MRPSVVSRVCILLVLAAFSIKCGSDKSPTTPTPPPSTTPTRIIGLSGNLSFGDVAVGGSREATLTIANTGNASLTVSGMTVNGGLAQHVSSSWTSGQIAAGASQAVTIRFAPTAGGSFSGTVAVNGDQTSGTNTIAISGTGIAPPFTGTWTGAYRVERCDGTGSVQDLMCSTNRGLYPPGTILPIRLILTQNGNAVTGTIALGQVEGQATGTVANGALLLQGTARSSTLTATLSAWNTRVDGNAMEGTFTFNASDTSVPGVAVIVTTLIGVRR